MVGTEGRRGGGGRHKVRRGTLARALAGVAAIAAIALALLGAPVAAQLPTLPPLVPDPSSSTSSTTTSTLLPDLGKELLGTAPPPADPATNPLNLPATTAPRKFTSYKPPAIPGSTPPQPLTTAPRQRGKAPSAAPAADDTEDGYQADLPFAPADGNKGKANAVPAGTDVELGAASNDERVRGLSAVAAGLILVVLLGVVLWLRGEALTTPPSSF